MTMIRVVLVDDHAAFRDALALVLNAEPDFTVVGQAGSLTETYTLLARADVVLVDLNLGGASGFALLSEIQSVAPGVAALVLTASGSRADRARAMELGAAGLLHKSATVDGIADAVRRVARGERLYAPDEMAQLLRLAVQQRDEQREAQVALGRLTSREGEVLRLLAEGLSDKEIAQRLVISVETVRSHMVRLLGKLDVQSRLQAVVFAARHGAVRIS
jgi:DNA-binding NarL/FixJ family response regulator